MLTFKVAELEFFVEHGTTIQQICAQYDTPIIFGCRAAKCGACIVRILDGGKNLGSIGTCEQAVLDILAAEPDHRLACQCTVLGDVTVEVG
jgi:ferredoxin